MFFGIDMLSAFGISYTMYDFFTIPAYEFDIEFVWQSLKAILYIVSKGKFYVLYKPFAK